MALAGLQCECEILESSCEVQSLQTFDKEMLVVQMGAA